MPDQKTYRSPKGVRIGTTTSKKPIMENFEHEAHAGFDANDHRDAYFAHRKHAQNIEDIDPIKAAQHNELAKQHWQARLSLVDQKQNPTQFDSLLSKVRNS